MAHNETPYRKGTKMSRSADTSPLSLKHALDKQFEELSKHHSSTPEHAKIVTQIETLYKLREVDAKVNATKRVSADTWATIAANLVGITLIVGYEQKAVLTSQAMKLIKTLR